MEKTAKTVWLKHFVDEGIPQPNDFEIHETKVNAKDMQEGDVLVESLVMSVDPYLRGMIKSASNPGKSGNFPMNGFVAGKVLDSKHKDWKVGDLFGANLNFSTVQIVKYEHGKTTMWNLTDYIDEKDISYGIGVLGMPGSTAWSGLIKILRPNEGETLFVSAASGAVGGLVGQIAKIKGVKNVIGSCGGEKTKLIKDKLGYDHAIDYKALDISAPDKGKSELINKLRECAPDGIDMYFENVGGIHFDAAFSCLRKNGRIALCGSISAYNDREPPKNEIILQQMIGCCQRIEGFLCFPYLTEGSFLPEMAQWVKDGKLKVEETVVDGVENWPSAFQSLFTGDHKGKLVVRM